MCVGGGWGGVPADQSRLIHEEGKWKYKENKKPLFQKKFAIKGSWMIRW